MQLRPITPSFGAEASGVELRKPLDAATVRAIDEAMDKYAVLVFRSQPLSEAEQVALARRFGPLDAGLRKATGAPTRFQHEELIDIGNSPEEADRFLRDEVEKWGKVVKAAGVKPG